MLWLSSPEAKFLNGRMVWSNWDVDELVTKKDMITAGTMLTIGYEGWPMFTA
jgi:hypothetical protein